MKEPRPPKFVTTAIMTTITIIFWVFYSVYIVLTTEPENTVETEVLAPIEPQLNVEVLNSLDDRLYFNDNEIVGFTVPTPTQTPQEIDSTITVDEELSEEFTEDIPETVDDENEF